MTDAVIGAAIEVHRHLGPGLLESFYRDALAHELVLRQLQVRREVPVAVRYKSQPLGARMRVDLIVGSRVVVEIKTVSQLLAVHHAQLATYLRLTGLPTGLLLNFHNARLADGIWRMDARALRPLPLCSSA